MGKTKEEYVFHQKIARKKAESNDVLHEVD
jgi:hypothetical protein